MAVREERVRNSGAFFQIHKAWVTWKEKSSCGSLLLGDVCDFLV